MRRPLLLLALLPGALAHAAGNAVELDGDGDYLALGALSPGARVTVEAWLEADATDGFHTVVAAVDPATARNRLLVAYVGGAWQVEIDDTNRSEGDTCAQTDVDAVCHTAAWGTAATHLAVTLTPSEARLYVDGALAATEAVSTSPSFGAAEWALGMESDTAGAFDSDAFEGVIDELRVWSVAHDADTIACLRDYAVVGTERGLYARWGLDEASGATTAADALGGFDATVEGDADFVASPFGLTASAGLDIGCFDYDGDGVTQDDGDCDPTDPQAYAGAPERWYDGVDQDCLGGSDFDQDGDGFDSASYGGGDCDDARADTYPGAPDEPYDGVVRDCDGSDEFDADGDGAASADYGGTDCDDADSSVGPDATEVWYDGVDQDCDGNDDDQDGDGHPVDDDCDDTDPDRWDDCSEGDSGETDGADGADGDDGADTAVDVADTAAPSATGVYRGGSCAGGKAAVGLLGLAALLGWRRRR